MACGKDGDDTARAQVFILGTEDAYTAIAELFCIFCPFALGFVGAKHRDSQVLWTYLVRGRADPRGS